MSKQYVRAMYKTGVYIAELIEKQEENNRALVKIIAVIKHPMQGNLHHPREVDVSYFHQRKALSQFEKAWAPLASLKDYEGEVPEYKDSLKTALEKEINKLENDDSAWASAALDKLKQCKNEYGF